MEEGNKNNHDFGAGKNFGLPGDYFQNSARSILNKVEWEEEHREFPELLSLRKGRGFILPENYFERKETNLELLAYSNLAHLKAASGFAVPLDYFDLAAFQSFENLNPEHGSESAILIKLNSIERKNNYVVPDNYFVFKQTALEEIGRKPREARVISLVRRSFTYSAAALLLVVLSIWVYKYYYQTAEIKDCGTIACVDKTDLLKTKNLEALDNDELYELVNPAELEKNLGSDKTAGTGPVIQDSGLKNTPSEELLDEI